MFLFQAYNGRPEDSCRSQPCSRCTGKLTGLSGMHCLWLLNNCGHINHLMSYCGYAARHGNSKASNAKDGFARLNFEQHLWVSAQLLYSEAVAVGLQLFQVCLLGNKEARHHANGKARPAYRSGDGSIQRQPFRILLAPVFKTGQTSILISLLNVQVSSHRYPRRCLPPLLYRVCLNRTQTMIPCVIERHQKHMWSRSRPLNLATHG